jgi:CheY-like chemotaxis protein
MPNRLNIGFDEADTLAMLSMWSTELGFDISVARNGSEALARVQEELPDLIVTDHSMPRMTGLELCAQRRARARTKDIPIIMYSSNPPELADGLRYDGALLKTSSRRRISDEIASLLTRSS